MKRCLTPLALTVLCSSLCMAQGQLVKVEKNRAVGKGGDVDLLVDLAMPREGEGPFPALVCIHGGGWHGGSRQQLDKSIETFAGRGYVAITVSYRLAPDAKFPAQIEDCKAAVRWLRANAKGLKINPDRIGALGYDAGAHLACLLGTTDERDGLEGNGGHGRQSSRVQAVVSFFGPTDFTTRSWSKEFEAQVFLPFLGASFDDKPDLYKRASPISYVSKDDPPFLFFHGTEDKLVNIRHSKLLAEKLQEVGVPARVVVLEGEGHGWKDKKLADTIEQTLEFLDERLKK